MGKVKVWMGKTLLGTVTSDDEPGKQEDNSVRVTLDFPAELYEKLQDVCEEFRGETREGDIIEKSLREFFSRMNEERGV